MAAIKILS